MILILHNIRSAHNVGSMFRTSDGAGVERIFITGYTPTPIDKFGRAQKEIAKTALGAEQTVPWEYRARVTPLINQLQNDGVFVVALEQTAEAKNYKNVYIEKPSALIVGNEVRGVSGRVRSLCNRVIEIPMKGKKESLNVSVATGIALFHLCE